MKVFEIDNICYSYADGTNALSNLSFSVEEGEVLGVIGANGSGKSTLLMHLMGCLSPSSGQIFYNGELLTKGLRRKLRAECGLLFQNPEDQLFLPTVREDAAFGPRNFGCSEDEVTERVNEALTSTGIESLCDKAPWKLSGGEKTLAALAGLFAMRPQVLLLDEPTAGLDPRSRTALIDIIKQISYSVIIATHDLDMVLDTCDRVIILNGGTVAGESYIPGFLTDGLFMERCGLELPLTVRGSAY